MRMICKEEEDEDSDGQRKDAGRNADDDDVNEELQAWAKEG